MDYQVRQWRDDQKHLPEFMRDFHNCKDLFKAIDQYIVCPDDHPGNNVSWRDAHCYTIDVFLWFMAQHGYTLQKNRTKIPFDDLLQTLKEIKQDERDRLNAILMNTSSPQ